METIDLYQEHSLHDTYEEQCSTCYSENRLQKAYDLVNFDNTIKFMGDVNKAIYGINPYDQRNN